MNEINAAHFNSHIGGQPSATVKKEESSSGFGKFMNNVADGALAGVAAVAPFLPGGEIVKLAANGLRGVSPTGSGLGAERADQLDNMWQMQQDNQIFNLQYMHLQQAMQADNRHFSTMSNLLKARHDTAKTAINNMRV